MNNMLKVYLPAPPWVQDESGMSGEHIWVELDSPTTGTLCNNPISELKWSFGDRVAIAHVDGLDEEATVVDVVQRAHRLPVAAYCHDFDADGDPPDQKAIEESSQAALALGEELRTQVVTHPEQYAAGVMIGTLLVSVDAADAEAVVEHLSWLQNNGRVHDVLFDRDRYDWCLAGCPDGGDQ